MAALFLLILLAVAIGFISATVQSPKNIGKSGENFVSKRLNELDEQYYKILDDIMLPSNGNTSTTQIDHIVISNFGIFCVETKAYSGWIFGRAHDKYWTQVINRYNKNRFYNPLRQNYAHAKAIQNLIISKHADVKIFPLVAFPDADKLKITGTDLVGFARDVVDKIRAVNEIVLSDVDRDEIYNIISRANIVDDDARQKQKDIRERIYMKMKVNREALYPDKVNIRPKHMVILHDEDEQWQQA